jgi:hypothetical protein
VGPTAGLDAVEKRKFLTLLGFELRPSVFQPVANCYTDYAIPSTCVLINSPQNAFVSRRYSSIWHLANSIQ